MVYAHNAVSEISTVVFTNAVGQATRAEYIRTNGWNCGYVLTLANGSAIIRTLERDWERPQLVTRVLTTFNGNTIRDYQYAYDILGRITNRIDNGVQMNSFAYNPRSEVLYALFGTNETDYAYDDIGNHSLYPANNLNQYVDNAIAYDADGNMIRKGGWTFGWDAENRLASADNGTTSITNAYDYKHRRVRKTVGSESHAFVYDGWNLISETVNDMERTHYFWGLDLSDSLLGAGGVGGLLAVSQDGAMYYPVCDNNGNVTAYLDDSGNIVASYEYNAFGETLSQSGSRANEFAFRFSTKYHDNETGLYYYGYRFYDPTLRTWLSRDPIEEDGGLNLYGFSRNNGLNLIDYLGMKTCCCQQTKQRHQIIYPTKWSGTCGIFDAGFGLGMTYIACALESDITSSCKKWSIGVQAVLFGGITPGAGASTSSISFTGAEEPKDFLGPAGIIGGNFIVIGGVSGSKIKLGKAVSTGFVALNLGIDIGVSAMVGFSSILSETQIPCANW